MRRLATEDRARIVACLCEGNSMAATIRITGFAKKTVERTLREVGSAVWAYQNKTLVGLNCKRVQADEIWTFCGAKEKNVPAEKRASPDYGDVWTWTAIDADTKLVPCWLVADRHLRSAWIFLEDLASRIEGQVQLSTDGFAAYQDTVQWAFQNRADYGRVLKKYGVEDHGKSADRRYSPSKCISAEKIVERGNPDPDHISTSFAERQNLTMRMNMRRYTRLTNAFSKKLENLRYAVALYFMHYNFARPHKTLKGETPAMAAGVAQHRWTVEEITALAVGITIPAKTDPPAPKTLQVVRV